jgi:hypothetical protein
VQQCGFEKPTVSVLGRVGLAPAFQSDLANSPTRVSRSQRAQHAGAGAGRTLGSLNLLHEAGWYGEDDVAACLPFAQLALPALLTQSSSGDRQRDIDRR